MDQYTLKLSNDDFNYSKYETCIIDYIKTKYDPSLDTNKVDLGFMVDQQETPENPSINENPRTNENKKITALIKKCQESDVYEVYIICNNDLEKTVFGIVTKTLL